MNRLSTLYLTKAQISKIEEAMNTDDLEQMVAVVDRMIGTHRAKTSILTAYVGRTLRAKAARRTP